MKYLLLLFLLPSCIAMPSYWEAQDVSRMDLASASFSELERTYLKHWDKLGYTPGFLEKLQLEIFKKSGWPKTTIVRMGMDMPIQGDTKLQVAMMSGYTFERSRIGVMEIWRYPRRRVYFRGGRVFRVLQTYR